MPDANAIARKRQDVAVTADDLLCCPEGPITEAGPRQNLNVGLGYLEAWLCGNGCLPLYNLMEDAATAEISRSQVWQWIRHRAKLADGRIVTRELARKILEEELGKLKQGAGEGNRYDDAAKLFLDMIEAKHFVEFLTLPAYEQIVREGA